MKQIELMSLHPSRTRTRPGAARSKPTAPPAASRSRPSAPPRWLEANGVAVQREGEGLGSVAGVIEIKQTTAIYPQDLAGLELPAEVRAGEDVLL